MEWLDIALSLSALIILEIVLGIDNLVFLAILTEKLPAEQRRSARRWGLSMAWITRLMLLASAVWIVRLKTPFLHVLDRSFSVRDVFLLGGGAFLIAKATQEIRYEVGDEDIPHLRSGKSAAAFRHVVIQVGLMDVIFSLDSVLTAIGLSTRFWVMAVAITCAIWVMIFASEAVCRFIEKHPTLKMLALSFLILIGVVLIADGLHFHVPRGYIYFAMGFSLAVEGLNHVRRIRRRRRK